MPPTNKIAGAHFKKNGAKKMEDIPTGSHKQMGPPYFLSNALLLYSALRHTDTLFTFRHHDLYYQNYTKIMNIFY